MHRIIVVLMVLSFLLSNACIYAEVTQVENKKDWMAQLFIANQIKGIGFVDSYQEDNEGRSYVYDNALAAMASMAMANFGLATEILDTLCFEVNKTTEGVPFESYLYSNAQDGGSGLAYAGNSAWLLQALNIYQKKRASNRYYETQKKLADFLLTLQDAQDGALRGSSSDYWKSTEHNLVAYVALKNFGQLNHFSYYITQAKKIRTFLLSSQIWDGARFNQGANDNGKVIDAQALGVLVFKKNYSSALSWAEANLKLSASFNGDTLTGFDFNDDRDTIWLEGTLQAALAFYCVNNGAQGDYYYNEASKAIQNDGSVFLATNQGSASDWWILEQWRAIAPTSWLIFYCQKFNPLIVYSGQPCKNK